MLWHQKDREPAEEGDKEPAEEEGRSLRDVEGEWAEAAASAPEEIAFAPIAGKRRPTHEGHRALRSPAQSAAPP